MQITQGPWYANGENVQTVAMSVANHICKVEGLTQEEVLANAQAIASVPAMLDVLKKIVDLPVSQRGNNRGTAIIPMDILHQVNEVFERATYQKTPYEIRVEQLEKEGCTTSDAQGIADYEEGRGVLDEMIADYLRKHAATEKQYPKVKVVVEVEGGVVSGAFSDVDFEYIVIDHDEMEDPDTETPDSPAFSDGTTANDVMFANNKRQFSSAQPSVHPSDNRTSVLVNRWNAPRYAVGATDNVSSDADFYSFELEVTDHRASNGQLYVDVAPISGDVNDILSVIIEVNGLTDEMHTQTMHLAFGYGENAASFFKYGDTYKIRLEPGVTLEQVASDPDGLVIFELK